jgi:pentatricopeptide repeat protein
MNPNYLYPLNNIANCYLKMGQTDKACEYWKSALSKGYVYNPAWKKEFDIDDPKELVKQHCN